MASSVISPATEAKRRRLLTLHEQGKGYLKIGVEHEECGHLEEALECYRLALVPFREAIGIVFTPAESSLLKEPLSKLASLMELAVDRRDELEEVLQVSAPKCSSSPSSGRLTGFISSFFGGGPSGPSGSQEGPAVHRETLPLSHRPASAPVKRAPQERRKSVGAAAPATTPRKSAVASSTPPVSTPARKPPVPTFSKASAKAGSGGGASSSTPPDYSAAAAARGVDPKLYQEIMHEVIDHSIGVKWTDIAGLELAKSALDEAVILPSKNPSLFTGLRAPPKGILLFGPPGNGKTMLAKAVASESGSTFFSISASSLVSKWVGESERLCKALFAAARDHQPAVIFIDEIDSMLSARSANENESSRRLKTEFLVQMDGCGTSSAEERVLIMAATNRPQELDDAALRRFTKRILIPLPEAETRLQLIKHLLKDQRVSMTAKEERKLAELTVGYSGSDLSGLCKETAHIPIREMPRDRLESLSPSDLRPVTLADFQTALRRIRPSVSRELLAQLETWNADFGCSS